MLYCRLFLLAAWIHITICWSFNGEPGYPGRLSQYSSGEEDMFQVSDNDGSAEENKPQGRGKVKNFFISVFCDIFRCCEEGRNDHRESIGRTDGDPINITFPSFIGKVAERENIAETVKRFSAEVKEKQLEPWHLEVIATYMKRTAKTINLPKYKIKRIVHFADLLSQLADGENLERTYKPIGLHNVTIGDTSLIIGVSMSDAEIHKMIEEVGRDHTKEIVGKFKEEVYKRILDPCHLRTIAARVKRYLETMNLPEDKKNGVIEFTNQLIKLADDREAEEIDAGGDMCR